MVVVPHLWPPAHQALQEFVSGWDKADDAPVTWADFLDYYADISAGLPADDDFELLMRSVWHISGGVRAMPL